MKPPQVSLATLMVVVLVVAVNISLGDTYFGMAGPEKWLDLQNFGARPMASLLAVALWPTLRGRSLGTAWSRFWVGFEVAGAAALVAFLVAIRMLGEPIHAWIDGLLRAYLSPGRPSFPHAVTLLLLGPQLVVAGLGGWLNAARRTPMGLPTEHGGGPIEPTRLVPPSSG